MLRKIQKTGNDNVLPNVEVGRRKLMIKKYFYNDKFYKKIIKKKKDPRIIKQYKRILEYKKMINKFQNGLLI